MVRLTYIDYMKALCIVCMVVCHYGLHGPIIQTLIYGFHMPLLFFISGYLYKKRLEKSEIKSFGIPIIIFSIIGILWGVFFNTLYQGNETFTDYILNTIPAFFSANHGNYHTPFTGIWFVLGLFILRLLVNKINLSKIGIPLTILCVLVTESNNVLHYSNELSDLYILKPIQIFPFFFLGYYLKNKVPEISIKTYQTLLMIAFYVAMSIFNGKIDMYYGDFGKSFVLTILQTTILFLSLKNLLNIKENNVIKILSVGTFFILGTHSIVFPKLVHPLGKLLIFNNTSVIAIAVLYFAIIVPLIAFINARCPIVLGKLSKK